MKKDIAEKWVEALRSGKYRQTTHYLARPLDDGSFSYCCLGVLCEFAILDGVPLTVETHKWQTYPNHPHLTYDGSQGGLPLAVKGWAGVQDPSGYPALDPPFRDAWTAGDDPAPLRSISLMEMNDTGRSFDEIAAYIEANWENL